MLDTQNIRENGLRNGSLWEERPCCGWPDEQGTGGLRFFLEGRGKGLSPRQGDLGEVQQLGT